MKNLRKLRIERHLSQRELGKLLNIKQQSICSYENGRSSPGIETIVAIADFFHVSVDYLLGRPEKRQKNITKQFLEDLQNKDLSKYSDEQLIEIANILRDAEIEVKQNNH